MKTIKIYTKDDRFYKGTNNDGEIVFAPSVTSVIGSVIKPAGLIAFFKNHGIFADEVSKQAMGRGSRVHNGIDEVIKGATITPDYMNPDEYVLVSRAINFVKSLNYTTIESEKTFITEEPFAFGGTIDLLWESKEPFVVRMNRKEVEFEPGYYMGDWKTGQHYETHILQASAYYKAMRLEGKDPKGFFFMYPGKPLKSGGFTVKFYNQKQLEDGWDKFVRVYQVYLDWFRPPTPQLLEIPAKISLED